jgi:hypothetical protein
VTQKPKNTVSSAAAIQSGARLSAAKSVRAEVSPVERTESKRLTGLPRVASIQTVASRNKELQDPDSPPATKKKMKAKPPPRVASMPIGRVPDTGEPSVLQLRLNWEKGQREREREKRDLVRKEQFEWQRSLAELKQQEETQYRQELQAQHRLEMEFKNVQEASIASVIERAPMRIAPKSRSVRESARA